MSTNTPSNPHQNIHLDLVRVQKFNEEYDINFKSYYTDNNNELLASSHADLSTYSEDSRKDPLFLSKFFQKPVSKKNYIHIGQEVFSNPNFFYQILENNLSHFDLLLLFNENILDEYFEQTIIKKYAARNYNEPLFKFCHNEFFLNGKSWDDQAIKLFTYNTILQNNDNIDFLPDSLKNNDNVLLDMVYDKQMRKLFFNESMQRFGKIPKSIFNFRKQDWWNNNPNVFLEICKMGKGTFDGSFTYKNIKKNPLYFFHIMQEDTSIFRRNKNIVEDDYLRILAAQHLQDFYQFDDSKKLNLEMYNSNEIVEIFLRDLPFYSFDNHTNFSREYFASAEIKKREGQFFYPSKQMAFLAGHILETLSEEQYLKSEIFKPTTNGNPLLILASFSSKFTTPKYMIDEVVQALHSNLYVGQQVHLYLNVLKDVITDRFKEFKELYPHTVSKNFINEKYIAEHILPLIEAQYLENMTQKMQPKSSNVKKF